MKQRSPHGRPRPWAPCIPRPADVPPAAPGRLCSGLASLAALGVRSSSPWEARPRGETSRACTSGLTSPTPQGCCPPGCQWARAKGTFLAAVPSLTIWWKAPAGPGALVRQEGRWSRERGSGRYWGGGALTLQVGTPGTRCADSPKLGAAHLGPGSPIRTPGPAGAPARFPNEDGPSSQTLSPYPVLLGRIYFIFRTGPGDGQEQEPHL